MAFPLKCQQIRGLFLHSWTRPNHRNMIKYGWIQLYHHFIPGICIYIYILCIYVCLYLYIIYITYTIQLYSWFYTHFPASDFFSFSVFRAWNSGHSWSQVQPRGCSEASSKERGWRKDPCGNGPFLWRIYHDLPCFLAVKDGDVPYLQ